VSGVALVALEGNRARHMAPVVLPGNGLQNLAHSLHIGVRRHFTLVLLVRSLFGSEASSTLEVFPLLLQGAHLEDVIGHVDHAIMVQPKLLLVGQSLLEVLEVLTEHRVRIQLVLASTVHRAAYSV